EGNGHFLFIGLENRADGGDGAAAANCGAGGNQKRRIAANLQKFSECEAEDQCKGNSQRSVDESAAARFQDFVQVHSETESHYGDLQKNARGGAAGLRKRMREAQAEENSREKGDGRRENSGKGKRERQKKNYFRENLHGA